MDRDMEPISRRSEDLARRIAMEMVDQVVGYQRQQIDALEKLLNERFRQIHDDNKSHSAKLEDLIIRVQGLDKQSALNGAALTLLKEQVAGLTHDLHGQGGVIPRVRELEKSQAGAAPIISGAGKIVMGVLMAVIAAVMGWLYGQKGG